MPKIVLIEDDRLLAENTKTILELNGFECFMEHEGQKGIQLIKTTCPDLVVCDIMLDEIDGFEILREVRATHNFLNLPFIFLTARADFGDKRKGMNLGADDFLTKPFMSRDLIEAIKARLTISAQKNASTGVEIRKSAVDVFYKVSNHEYLTPLNGIVNLSEIVVKQLQNHQIHDAITLVEGINVSGQRMLRITRKLLWYNQLSNYLNPWQNTNSHTIFVIDLQQKIINNLKRSSTKNIDIILKSSISSLSGYDETHIEQIFTEIYQNIFQYADPLYTIYSDARLENNMFVLIVRNQYKADYTFSTYDITPFFQAHNPKDMNGTGLGLYIVKEWVKSVDGYIEVKGENHLFEVLIKIPINYM
ncbi:ATP-binding response regulator [Flectobacillus major]|uniref:ATP-binding response regulator n=1 Tax=Flectobacillus major TaxID=103 RepID=UPI0005C471AB|nr:response regulator [Flectobacillus major]